MCNNKQSNKYTTRYWALFHDQNKHHTMSSLLLFTYVLSQVLWKYRLAQFYLLALSTKLARYSSE